MDLDKNIGNQIGKVVKCLLLKYRRIRVLFLVLVT